MTLYRAGGEGWEAGDGKAWGRPIPMEDRLGEGRARMGKGHLGLGPEAGGEGSVIQDVGPGGRRGGGLWPGQED